MIRRNFLRILATAPVAAPVAVKEAAAKMGLSSVTAAFASGGNVGLQTGVPMGDREYTQQRWEYFLSSGGRRDRVRQAQFLARTLDSDIAAMRSISPAGAYALQVERALARIESEERVSIAEAAKRAGLTLLGIGEGP